MWIESLKKMQLYKIIIYLGNILFVSYFGAGK